MANRILDLKNQLESLTLLQFLYLITAAAIPILWFYLRDRMFHGKRFSLKKVKFKDLIDYSNKVLDQGYITNKDRMLIENEVNSLLGCYLCSLCVVSIMNNQNYLSKLKNLKRFRGKVIYSQSIQKIILCKSSKNYTNKKKINTWLALTLLFYAAFALPMFLSLHSKTIHWMNELGKTFFWFYIIVTATSMTFSLLVLIRKQSAYNLINLPIATHIYNAKPKTSFRPPS